MDARTESGSGRIFGTGRVRTRHALRPDQLHELLSAAFTKVKPPRCGKCAVPTPTIFRRMSSDAANWWLGPLDSCDHHCATFMRWLWHQYSAIYDLVE